jgi:diketogulonate reductase-like aldo/keto reductase
VKHLEEIRSAGLDMPSVNQIEVRVLVLPCARMSTTAPQLHPFCQQSDVVTYCREHSIVVQAYCPILRGKTDHEVIRGVASKVGSSPFQQALSSTDNEQHNRDPAQILLRWSLQRGYVIPFTLSLANSGFRLSISFVPLVKSATPSRIHSNAKLYDFELDAHDMTALDNLDQGKDGAISWNPIDVD